MENTMTPVMQVFEIVATKAFGKPLWVGRYGMKSQMDNKDYANLLLRVRSLLPYAQYDEFSVTFSYINGRTNKPYKDDGITYLIIPHKGKSQHSAHVEVGTTYWYMNELDHVLTYCLNQMMLGEPEYGEKEAGMFLLPLEALMGSKKLKEVLIDKNIKFEETALPTCDRDYLRDLLFQTLNNNSQSE